MRTGMFIIFFTILLVLSGCHRAQVKLTVKYDRYPQTVYPYSSYGDVAKVYWTVGIKNFEQEVRNHQSIKLTVPPRTAMRATLEKSYTDVNGFHTSREDVFFTADHDHNVWSF